MGGGRGVSPLRWDAESLLASLSAGPTTSWASPTLLMAESAVGSTVRRDRTNSTDCNGSKGA